MLLLLLCLPMIFHNASCTMFLVKEGYKEIKKVEEERKEKKEQQERQEQRDAQPRPDSSDDTLEDESPPPRHHGQWTPEREE